LSREARTIQMFVMLLKYFTCSDRWTAPKPMSPKLVCTLALIALRSSYAVSDWLTVACEPSRLSSARMERFLKRIEGRKRIDTHRQPTRKQIEYTAHAESWAAVRRHTCKRIYREIRSAEQRVPQKCARKHKKNAI